MKKTFSIFIFMFVVSFFVHATWSGDDLWEFFDYIGSGDIPPNITRVGSSPLQEAFNTFGSGYLVCLYRSACGRVVYEIVSTYGEYWGVWSVFLKGPSLPQTEANIRLEVFSQVSLWFSEGFFPNLGSGFPTLSTLVLSHRGRHIVFDFAQLPEVSYRQPFYMIPIPAYTWFMLGGADAMDLPEIFEAMGW